MYVVVAGKVRISKRVPGVGEEALGILEAGSHFGEMAMVDDSPRSADAIAHTACALAVIRREQLDQLMFVDKDLAYDLLWTFVRTLSARLRETNEKIKGLLRHDRRLQVGRRSAQDPGLRRAASPPRGPQCGARLRRETISSLRCSTHERVRVRGSLLGCPARQGLLPPPRPEEQAPVRVEERALVRERGHERSR